MKIISKKISIPIYVLGICFVYGVCVGKYRLFPYEQIAATKRTIKGIIRPVKKLNNDELLAELTKTNNIESNDNLSGLKSISSTKKSNSFKIISLGDHEFKNMNGLKNFINLQNSSLIIHLGDLLVGGSPCTDSRIDYQRELMNDINIPFLYTPGDNEWLDCLDESKGDSHNLERLTYIRDSYFSNDETLGGNPSIVENQRMRGYPENARLMKNNIAFITAHLVGSNNNFDPWSKENMTEYLLRDAANFEWITKSFERYKHASAYVVMTHGNIFTSFTPERKYKNRNTIPLFYKKFANALLELSNKYKKPVLLLNGNVHRFKAFQPMKSKFPNLHVIQNFGHPDTKAIEIEINPLNKIPFNVTKLIDLETQ